MPTRGERGRAREREGSTRRRASLARAIALALVACLVVPLAGADHVFSHRLYVVGRVIDVDGRPAAGVPIEIAFEGVNDGGGCYDNPPERTGGRGDFSICRHVHRLNDSATVTVRAGNASRRLAIDPDLRHASVHLQLDTASAHDLNAERQFQRTFTVTGRAFALLPEPTEQEAVLVNATPLLSNVSVELRVLDRVIASGEARPNEHGTYRVDLDVTDVPATATARAFVGRDIGEDSASPLYRRADVNVVRDLRLIDGPGDDAPGSSDMPAPIWVALAALALTSAALGGRSRSPPRR